MKVGKRDKVIAIAWVLAISVMLLDIFTKFYITEHIPVVNNLYYRYPYGGIPVFKNFYGIEFSIHHATNKGAAWGMLSSYQEYLIYIRIVLIFGLLMYAWKFNEERKYQIPLALIIAGAACNVLDYFLYGHVIDMFHFIFWGYDYPIFNVADAAICIGVFFMIVLGLFSKNTPVSSSRDLS